MKNSVQPRLAVDIGGTFTDVAIETGETILTAKTLTTHDRPVDGVLRGIEFAMTQSDQSPEKFASVIHGTTLATNALIERRGARVGVITTDGFRDILEIGYERRYDQYDMYLEKQDMIVPRDRVFGVKQRIDINGVVLEELDLESLEIAIDSLLELEVESIAVCLLHAYKNPAHEKAIEAAIRRRTETIPISLSAEVSPEIREFDRMCTTVANAYIKPLMAGYLRELEIGLSETGFACPLFLITSGGGMTTLDTALRFPIRLVESGPSGGAILAARIAAQRDIANVLSFDMGGTTAKVCLVENQTPRTSRSFEIGRAERFMKGSGLPVRIPVIDMIEIGAGGGSIAAIDELGRLRVGPKSASSDPGPACYARGGEFPTVTDADLMIGYIDPQLFAEGRVKLQAPLSQQAIESHIAGIMGGTVYAAADGISQMVDEAMANAARMHAVEQGKNLADCVMIAFGGNGPLHATRVADKIGIQQIVVPQNPSVGSAVGFLSAPVTYEIVRSHYALVKSMPCEQINQLLAQLEREASEIVLLGAPGEALQVKRIAFMRYAGQGHEIEINVPEGDITPDNLNDLVDQFESEYIRLFGRVVPDMDIEVMNWSLMVSNMPDEAVKMGDVNTKNLLQPDSRRELILGQAGEKINAAVYWREQLMPGDCINGPALIVEPQTTSYVSDRFEAEIDGLGNIVMNRVKSTQNTLSSGQFSAIELQVMWDRLLAIVEEQGQVLMRTAFSPIVRECGDISAGIFDLEGRMLAQAVSGTPGHINTMAASVSLMLGHFAVEDMAAGDIFLTNDPWIGSGHLNDVLLVAPIFLDGRVVALTACTSHVYDLGGLGMGPDGSDVFDEGLFIPPLKLVDQGEINKLVMSIMKANSRSPISNEGDIYALIACCDTASVRLGEMMQEFVLDDIDILGKHILTTSQRATIAAINELPQGVFVNEMMIDGYDFEILLKAEMTIEKDRVITDFAGSSPHSARGINVPINYTAAYGVFAMRCLIGADIPNNAGSLAPFEFVAPENCIINAQPPAPVATRHVVGHMVSDLTLGCLHQAVPGRAPAEGSSCLWDLPIRSTAAAAREAAATSFATEFTHSGGTGARPTLDGLSATAYPSGVYGTQVEIAESTVPVRIRRRELIRDSGGAGQYRGGLGQMIELESSEQAPILLFAGVERTRYPARGREGGQEGRLGYISLASGPKFEGKGQQTIPADDLLLFETPGGGGYGAPWQRDIEAVVQDVRQGLVSRNQAAEVYGVELDDEGKVDQAATSAHRGQFSKGAMQ